MADKFSSRDTSITKTGDTGSWAAGLVINNVRRWTATINAQLVDATSKSDGGYSFDVYGVKSCTGTITMAASKAVGLLSSTTAATGYDPGATDAKIQLILYDTTTDSKISGDAKINTTSLNGISYTDAAELPEVTFDFRYQGKFYIVPPA